MSPRDPLTEWSTLIFRALAAAGIRDVVISPGSRSTPFVLAASHTEGLRCWDIVDERSAAFFALGQAKASGRPSVVVCTSGSAGAHFLPAIVEANASHTPLILFTADRPLDLQACAAPQTIDQVKLFGDQVRGFFELGLPDPDVDALRAIPRLAAQAVLTTQWPLPGPVHINARARKPLEPHAPTNEMAREAGRRMQATEVTPRTFPPRAMPSEEGIGALVAALRSAHAPLFVAGPGPVAQAQAAPALAALVRRCQGVLLADAASQLRFTTDSEMASVHASDAYLELPAFAQKALPDLVVQLGAAPTSTTYANWLKPLEVERWVLAPHGWNDPDSRASQLLFGELGEIAAAVGARLPAEDPPPTDWQRIWQRAEAAAQKVLATHAEGGEILLEGTVVRQVLRALRPGSRLAIGNSLPLRELDLFGAGSLARCEVLSQRGANGIDGLISGAAGAASTGVPVTLLLGDISFLHDLGGLWAAGQVGEALTIVVLQNRGGRIFEDLPLAAAGVGEAIEHFTTPHRADLGAAAAIYGLRHARVETRTALKVALEEAPAGRCRVIEALVPPRGLGALRREIVEQLSGVLA